LAIELPMLSPEQAAIVQPHAEGKGMALLDGL
jgi:hypothetical protein